MKELLIQIHDENRVPFIIELLHEFDFVEIKTPQNGRAKKPRKKKFTPEQQEFIDDLKGALRDVELHMAGKLELQTIEEFLEELRADKGKEDEEEVFEAELVA